MAKAASNIKHTIANTNILKIVRYKKKKPNQKVPYKLQYEQTKPIKHKKNKSIVDYNLTLAKRSKVITI